MILQTLSFDLRATFKELYQRYWIRKADNKNPTAQRIHHVLKQMAPQANSSLKFQADLYYHGSTNAQAVLEKNTCYIGILEGMWHKKWGIIRESSQDDLAAILGHEMGHCLLAARARPSDKIEVPPILGLSRYLSPAERIEAESDRLGLIMMAKAGFNPHHSIEVMRRAHQKGLRPSGGHPPFLVRVEYLRRFLTEAMHYYQKANNKY